MNGIPQLMTPSASNAGFAALSLVEGALIDYLSTEQKWGIYYSGTSQQVILGQSKPSSISGILGQATSLSGAKSLLNGELVANDVYIDSVISVGQRKGSELSNYRIETGSFTTFNKVEKPRQIQIKLIKSGTEEERGMFLAWLDKRSKGYTTEVTKVQKKGSGYSSRLYAKNNMFDIYVPEVHYPNMTLIDYAVSREAASGANIIIAECIFQEVIEIEFRYANSKTDNAKNPSDKPTPATNSVMVNSPSPNAFSKIKGLFAG